MRAPFGRPVAIALSSLIAASACLAADLAAPNIADTKVKAAENNSKLDLRQYSIGLQQIGKLETDPKMPAICGVGPAWDDCFTLNRHGDKKIVAVVTVDRKHMATLNPQEGFDYGPIPELGAMTKTEADQLWGTDLKSDVAASLREYKLTSDRGDVLLQLMFSDDNHVEKYRITGPAIIPEWKLVACCASKERLVRERLK